MSLKKMMLYRVLTTLAVSSLMFTACGDDSKSSSNSNNAGHDGVDQVVAYDDLAHCTKSHYGEVVFVENDNKYYECSSEGWNEISEDDVEDLLSSSSESGSGDKDDGKDKPKSSSSAAPSKEDVEVIETQKVDSVTIKGFAEKGPFVKDAAVTVYGFDSAFKKTKVSFKGKVGEEKGAYTVEKVSLDNQYAIVEVSGFFYNEASGKNTSGTKTKLSALVDLSAGGTVKANVNVATELEKARALYLVQNGNFNVPAAKKRATKELLGIFGVSAESVFATDLSLQGSDSLTAGLYAASISMLGNLSLSKFQSRLSSVAESFAETGSISDTLRTELADYLALVDSTDGYAAILANVKKQNSKAPAFDKLLYAFWSSNYELPACTDKNEETQEKNKNKLSDNFGAGFTCASNRWHKSTKLDSELGLCIAKTEGTYKESADKKYYTCKEGQWREITKTQYELKECTADIAKSDSKKYKSVGDKEFFLCKDKQWNEISAAEYELKDCSSDKNNTLVKTKADGENYVCEDGAWRSASAQESEFGLCLKADSTRKQQESNSKYYACLKDGWTEVSDVIGVHGFCKADIKNTLEKVWDDSYVCDGEAWRDATEQESAFGLCLKADSTRNQLESDKKYYACLKEGWAEISDNEGINGFCTEDKKNTPGKDAEGSSLICNGSEWRVAAEHEVELGICDEEGKVGFEKTDGEAYGTPFFDAYTCTAGEWVVNECTKDKYQTIVNDEKICGLTTDKSGVETFYWRDFFEGESTTRKICWKKDLKYGDASNSVINDVLNGYACQVTTGEDNVNRHRWREATAFETFAGVVCNTNIDGNQDQPYRTSNPSAWVKNAAGDTVIVCVYDDPEGGSNKQHYWKAATEMDYESGHLCSSSFENTFDPSYSYVCDGSKWRVAREGEIATHEVCDYSMANKIIQSLDKSKSYICLNIKIGTRSSYAWRVATEGEIATGSACIADSLYRAKAGYICRGDDRSGYAWEEGGDKTDSLGYDCFLKTIGQFAWVNQIPYRCTTYGRNYLFEEFAYKTVKFGDSSYKVIDIGDQVWMAENIRYAPSKAYCYNENQKNCETYGSLWTFEDAKTACPGGVDATAKWHLPTDDEWKILEDYVAEHGMGSDSSGKSLRSKYGWSYGVSRDNFGFSAKPAGYKWGSSKDINTSAQFWTSSTMYSGEYGVHHYTSEFAITMHQSFTLISNDMKYSVRCVCNQGSKCYE